MIQKATLSFPAVEGAIGYEVYQLHDDCQSIADAERIVKLVLAGETAKPKLIARVEA